MATAEGSEHPGPSSPAQGADYTARVLDALTQNPEVWSKTVLLVNFDENDGFFDHVPPPAPPSYGDAERSALAGESTADTAGEYHLYLAPDADAEGQALQFQPYGLGPRVPLYVISPWSKGGWVNSEVFDHTSVIRFLERRFGVVEPNISAWRRAVCGDLTSTFDFRKAEPTDAVSFPDTATLAERARALPARSTPATPELPELPAQDTGARRSRALPYDLSVDASVAHGAIHLDLSNAGRAGACLHVYDRLHLDRVPRRYTLEAGRRLRGSWEIETDGGAHDLWVLGPNGFHRHFVGDGATSQQTTRPEIEVRGDAERRELIVSLRNLGRSACTFQLAANAYSDDCESVRVPEGAARERRLSVRGSENWYDWRVTVDEAPAFVRRFAGRLETGCDSISDPRLGGVARGAR